MVIVHAVTYVPTWNHRILLKPLGEKESQYTDVVEIYAGWKTPFVCLWAKIFYSHRHKKWLKLLNNKTYNSIAKERSTNM